MKRFLVALLACGVLASHAVAAPKVTDEERLQELFDISDNEERDAYGDWPKLGDGDDSASAVRAAQYLLRAHGFAISVDGRYGPQTRRAVERFQERGKLTQTGEDYGSVGWITWETLIFNPTKRGSNASAVRAVQSLLRAKGYKVALDGIYGGQTSRAVRAFQRTRKLPSTGTVGGETWCELVGGKAYK